MADASFTPGPWTATHNGHYWKIDSDTHGQIGDACSSNIIYIGGKELSPDQARPIAAANARLIAAAPDMLAALKATLAFAEVLEKRSGRGVSSRRGGAIFAKARAAIAKAEAAS